MRDTSLYENKSLIEAFINGDEKAFEKLYQIFYKKLFGSIFKIIRSDDVAKDLLQSVFVKLWQKKANIDTEQSFSSYLYRMAQNEVYNYFRTVARDHKLRERFIKEYTVKNSMNALEILEEIEEDSRINRLIEKLPPKRRQVFQLVKIDRLSYEEVSQKLNISKPTINDHIVKATKFLQEQVTLDPICLLLILLIF